MFTSLLPMATFALSELNSFERPCGPQSLCLSPGRLQEKTLRNGRMHPLLQLTWCHSLQKVQSQGDLV